jgi:hypothetical protein
LEDKLDVDVCLEQCALDVADQFFHCGFVNYACFEKLFYGVSQ